MGSVGFVGAVDAPGADDADGRLARGHDARLHGRGVRAQDDVVVDVESVLRVAGGMVLGQVEQLKVVVVVLDLRAFDHLITHANENLHQFVLHGVQGVGRAGGTGPYRHGHVDGLAL